MPNYRRARIPGGSFFFTVVTHDRRPFFEDAEVRGWLKEALRDVRKVAPFQLDAICLLPDHLHCIWTLPTGDEDFSRRWQRIKASVSKRAKRSGLVPARARTSRQRRREVDFWQRRFWEHCLKDEGDFRRHLDYIHYNPVKHGLVGRPIDWPWSSFRRYVRLGFYTQAWGVREDPGSRGSFGE
ncbi:MAG: transposase [Acidobacteria bacterium]|nr:transposase [Acidobacteriota bacterium]